MPKGVRLTEEEQESRCHEIFHKVVNLFVKTSFQETSMREIAAWAGIGSSTLYDYFKAKDDILLYFFEHQLNELTDAARRIALQDPEADKRLRQAMKADLEFLQANKSLFMKLTLESQRLKLDSQKEIQKKRHAYQDLIRGLIEEGVREGSFRKADSLLAACMAINTMAPVVFTSHPTGAAQEMMGETIDILFKGIEVCDQRNAVE